MKRMKAVVSLAVIMGCIALATGVTSCAAPPSSQQAAASRFLARYARPDGRIVRVDQGRDTVSEGQAYGMLLAEVAGDYGAFQRIWQWTHHHLQLPDGLFSFQTNAAGEVTGQNPASDADLLIAWALLRYAGPHAGAWHRAGRRVAHAILAHEVASGPHGMLVLTAGPWTTGLPAGSTLTLDPSYWSLPAMQSLARLTGSNEWHRLAVSAVSLTRQLSQGGRLLPPDWAGLSSSGAVQPERAPAGPDRKSTRLNSSHANISYAVFCLKKKKKTLITANLKKRGMHGKASSAAELACRTNCRSARNCAPLTDGVSSLNSLRARSHHPCYS